MTADSRTRRAFDFGSADHESSRVGGTRGAQGIRRLAPVLFVLAAAQLLDLVTFAFAVDRWGIQGELGPLGLVYSAAGYWAVAAVKSAMIGLVMVAMVAYRWQNPATPWRIGIVAALVGAFGAATNVAALL